MKKETKMDITTDILKLTVGAIITKFKDETGKTVTVKEGIRLKCNRWGATIYRKDELIQIRAWLRKNLKG